MQSTSARRFRSVIVPVVLLFVILSFGAVLLIGAVRDGAATTLVIVHAQGGPGHGAIAALATDEQEVVMSRSVGLMEGAATTDSATALGDTLVEVSRSVGLTKGTTASGAATALGDTPVVVSRSIGLMEGAKG